MQFFLMMYLVYKLALQNPSEMASLIKTYGEEAIKEVSCQAEKAGEVEENMSNNLIMNAIKSMLKLPDLETVDGAYIQQIYRVGNLHRDFFWYSTSGRRVNSDAKGGCGGVCY